VRVLPTRRGGGVFEAIINNAFNIRLLRRLNGAQWRRCLGGASIGRFFAAAPARAFVRYLGYVLSRGGGR